MENNKDYQLYLLLKIEHTYHGQILISTSEIFIYFISNLFFIFHLGKLEINLHCVLFKN